MFQHCEWSESQLMFLLLFVNKHGLKCICISHIIDFLVDVGLTRHHKGASNWSYTMYHKCAKMLFQYVRMSQQLRSEWFGVFVFLVVKLCFYLMNDLLIIHCSCYFEYYTAKKTSIQFFNIVKANITTLDFKEK
jgi:hypothetical protein